MEYEVERTSFVGWQDVGGPDPAALLILLGLFLGNGLVWLFWRALGRGWTLHVYEVRNDFLHRLDRQRFRTRQEAEATLLKRRVADEAAQQGA